MNLNHTVYIEDYYMGEKIAVVTSGTQEIGRAIVKQLLNDC